MQLLSPHYRNDSTNGIPDDIQVYLDEHYLKNLEHLDVVHPKLLIVFSGGSAIGKSVLAGRIKQEFQALVLENDAIKRCLQKLDPEMTRDEQSTLTWQYSMNLYDRLPEVTQNGLVVRDAVIDWYYDRILPKFLERGYELFVVAYDLSYEKRVELIKKRGDTVIATVERFITLLGDHDIHMKRFRSEYTPDVVLHDDDLFDYDPVIEALRQKLNSLSGLQR